MQRNFPPAPDAMIFPSDPAPPAANLPSSDAERSRPSPTAGLAPPSKARPLRRTSPLVKTGTACPGRTA